MLYSYSSVAKIQADPALSLSLLHALALRTKVHMLLRAMERGEYDVNFIGIVMLTRLGRLVYLVLIHDRIRNQFPSLERCASALQRSRV